MAQVLAHNEISVSQSDANCGTASGTALVRVLALLPQISAVTLQVDHLYVPLHAQLAGLWVGELIWSLRLFSRVLGALEV